MVRPRVLHGAAAENANDLATLERIPGCCGVKLFMGASTGNLLVADDANIKQVVALAVSQSTRKTDRE